MPPIIIAVCPECKRPGRVVLVNGKLSNRRICDHCRGLLWDVNGECNQLRLKLESQ